MDCSKDPNGLFEKYPGTIRMIILDCLKTIHGYDKTAFYCTKKIGNVRMSMNIELNETDYHNIMNWFDFAFGKEDPININEEDAVTHGKLTTIAIAFLEKEIERLKL